jgi:hypothetical protein
MILQYFQRKASYKNSGEIVLVRYEFRTVRSFLDYIMGGLQLNCTVAIDFTGKNKPPSCLLFFTFQAVSWGRQNKCPFHNCDWGVI